MPPYTEIRRVTVKHSGLPVRIILQTRHHVPPVDFYCLSWRTVLPTGRDNRRFYYDRRHGTGIWTIPVSIALRLLNRADEARMLDREYEDPQVRHNGTNNRIIDSRNLSRQERERAFASIVNVNRDPDWGSDPLFVIIQVPARRSDRIWRKIMIVDTRAGICTFRSTTTDTSYRQGVVDGMVPPWRLDNAMQDASCAMMREFQRILLEL